MIKYSRKFGDRYDGYRIRNEDPFFFIIPQVMRKRVDSQVYFDAELDITNLERFVREKSVSEIPGLKMYHVYIATMLRLFTQRPYLNRFAVGGKVYQRNYFSTSMAVKKRGEKEQITTIKIAFDPMDTLKDVVEKFNRLVEENKEVADENGTDKTAKVLGHMPAWSTHAIVALLDFLDRHGKMPKYINKVSPFHTSFFITNMGSLGIPAIYHHLYEFGSTSIFLAIGNKKSINELNDEGTPESKRKMGIKVVADERICEGAYYANSMRLLSKIIKDPEKLLYPPEKVVFDDGVILKGRKAREVQVEDTVSF